MKLSKPSLLLCSILVAMHFSTEGQTALDKVNFAYQYDPKAEFFLENQAVAIAASDSLSIFCKIVINDDRSNIKNYRFSFFSASSYAERVGEKLNADSLYIGSRGNSHFIRFNLRRPAPEKITVLQIKSQLSNMVYFYDIQPVEHLPLSVKDRSGVPLITNWIRGGTFEVDTEATALYYSYNYEPALPPMVTREPAPNKEMRIDSLIRISNLFALQNEGLYLLQKDTSDQNAVPLLLVDTYFPKPARLEQLKKPLIYISTRDEWKKLDRDSLNKKDFDRFWLDMTRSAERAKKVIKTYFDRVEEANQFFTTYKEGWKTDRGMIYIIYGAPDRVARGARTETWTYTAQPGSPAVNFEFIRVNSIFSSKHYALIRDRKYAGNWYSAVDRLRKARYR